MSREQLYLAGLLAILTVLALPAFVVAPSVEVNNESSQEEVKSSQFSTPETSLNLSRTTETDRKKIKERRKVNLNTADSATLQTLPNMGPNRAEDILRYRRSGNVFRNVDDLKKIEGFGERTAKRLKPHVKYGEDHYSPPSKSTSGKIDINSASEEELKSLSGVGTVMAQRIIEYRKRNGPFESYSDLDKVSGIGQGTIKNFEDKLEGVSGSIGSTDGESGGTSGKINVNTAGASELETLPGIGPVTANRIIEYRKNQGSFSSVDELDEVSGIGSATIEKIQSQVST